MRTPATIQFQNEIAKLQAERPGLTHAAAYRLAAGNRPDLAQAVKSETLAARRDEAVAQGLAKPDPIPEPPAFAVVPPQFFAPLALAPGVEPALFRAAWIANGGRLAPRNSPAILRAIIKEMRKSSGQSYLSALNQAAKRFPLLVSEARQSEPKVFLPDAAREVAA